MINKITLLGNVGADPEVRTLETGTKTARIRIATTENILNKKTNEWEQRTEWHNVLLWGSLADSADKYVRKGYRLYIEGTMHYRNYTDKSGVEKFTAEVTAKEMKILEKISKEPTAPAPTFAPPQYPTPQPAITPSPMPTAPTNSAPAGLFPGDDDLPF